MCNNTKKKLEVCINCIKAKKKNKKLNQIQYMNALIAKAKEYNISTEKVLDLVYS